MMGVLPTISGVRVIESINAVSCQQIKFPRSKKKRIQKKFMSNKGNWDMRPAIFFISGNIVAHPSFVQALKRRVAIVRL
jgi:hypothetical protein